MKSNPLDHDDLTFLLFALNRLTALVHEMGEGDYLPGQQKRILKDADRIRSKLQDMGEGPLHTRPDYLPWG